MKIRKADLNDIEDLLPLFNAYRDFYGRTLDSDKAHLFLTENLAGDRSVIFIAVDEQHKKAIGFMQLYRRLSSLSMTHYIYLSDLYVDEAYRKQGIAKLLMEQARKYSIDEHACFIELHTAHSNEKAQALYEALGYTMDKNFRTYILDF